MRPFADWRFLLFGFIASTSYAANNPQGTTLTTTLNTAPYTNEGVIHTHTGGGSVIGIDAGSDDAVTISNSGSIITVLGGYGINSQGENVSLTSTGSIATSGDSADGIHSSGSNAHVSVSGTIDTIGDAANAIFSSGDLSTIDSDAELTTYGINAAGVHSAGLSSIITNTGFITTKNTNSAGMAASGASSQLVNSREISTEGDSAYGLYGNADDIVLTSSSSIYTVGSSAHAMYGTGGNAQLTNSGELNTRADSANGMYLSGSSGSVDNSGHIYTSNTNAHGIFVSGAHADIENSGEILTLEMGAHAISTTELGALIKNTGTLNTAGISADAVIASGLNSIIQNSHLISTYGAQSSGIVATGDGASITNTGTVQTAENNAHPIAVAALATIVNEGTLQTEGASSEAIYVTSFNEGESILINNGTIRVLGDSAAIYSNVLNQNLTNSGVISTVADHVNAIAMDGPSSTFRNAGSLQVGGNNSVGFYVSGQDADIENSGLIHLSGQNAIAVNLEGDSSLFTNSGEIVLKGDNSTGVLSANVNTTMVHSGSIKAAGANGVAVQFADQGGILILKPGAILVGDLLTNNNSTLKIELGPAASYAYSTTGTWQIHDFANRPLVLGSVYAAGIGAQEAASHMLYQRMDGISKALDRRLDYYAPTFEATEAPAWVDSYYGRLQRDAVGTQRSSFVNRNYGINGGFQLPTYTTPVEMVFNFEQSGLNIESRSQYVERSGVLGGILAPQLAYVHGADIGMRFWLGWADHEGHRRVLTNSLNEDGYTQVHANYTSLYGLLGTFVRKGHALRPWLHSSLLGGMDLTMERVQAYSESDYYSWRYRILRQLHSRLEGEVVAKMVENTFELRGRVGLGNRYLFAGAHQAYVINNTPVSLEVHKKMDIYLHGVLESRFYLNRDFLFYGQIEGDRSSGKVQGFVARAGIRIGL